MSTYSIDSLRWRLNGFMREGLNDTLDGGWDESEELKQAFAQMLYVPYPWLRGSKWLWGLCWHFSLICLSQVWNIGCRFHHTRKWRNSGYKVYTYRRTWSRGKSQFCLVWVRVDWTKVDLVSTEAGRDMGILYRRMFHEDPMFMLKLITNHVILNSCGVFCTTIHDLNCNFVQPWHPGYILWYLYIRRYNIPISLPTSVETRSIFVQLT